MVAGLRASAKVLESPPGPTARAPVLDPTEERGVETGLGQRYWGTAGPKGRQQTSAAYGYRATSGFYR